MIIAMILIPLVAAVVAFAWRGGVGCGALLAATASVHAALTAAAWVYPPAPVLDGWLELESTGLLFLSIVSVLFLASAFYCVGYLARERSGQPYRPRRARLFYQRARAHLHGLHAAVSGLDDAGDRQPELRLALGGRRGDHAGQRTLDLLPPSPSVARGDLEVSADLFGRHRAGLAGYVSAGGLHARSTATQVARLVRADLIREAARLDPRWLELAFMLLLVGYGTKMGLAPMHTWLPDAHSESPSAVSALLSGALLNCAFLGILRIHQVCVAAGLASFSQNLLMTFGLLSMLIAAVFILGQTDFKRMLAYSSVEHMGILALGVGLGGAGVFGAVLHAVNHSL